MLDQIELLEGEEFVEVTNKGGRYFISNKGRVYDTLKEKICSLHDNGAGYYSASLYVRGMKDNPLNYIHRLVAQHFIPNPEDKKFVNHIDHDKSNNCVENLEWVTAKENTKHGIDAGRINAKLRGKVNKLTLQDRVRAVILRTLGYGINEIAVIQGVARTTISSVFNGRSNPELVELIQSEVQGWSETRLDCALNQRLK
jgi:hypothetical protein